MMRCVHSFLYFSSWFFFAVFGVCLNLCCLPLFLLPRRRWQGVCVRAVIRFLFRLWAFWFELSGVLRVEWKGFDAGLPKGAVVVANHPSLLDATFLLSKLPDAVCIFKRALALNPAIGAAATLAEFITAGNAVELVRQAAGGVVDGRCFLVFPEGTRTGQGRLLEPLKPGFALVAQRARAPVQLILIRASEGLVPRGRAWWKPPVRLPARLEFHLDACWAPDAGLSPDELARQVEERMRLRLAELAAAEGASR